MTLRDEKRNETAAATLKEESKGVTLTQDSKAERAIIEKYREKRKGLPARLKSIDPKTGRKTFEGDDWPDSKLWEAQLAQVTGASDAVSAGILLAQVIGLVSDHDSGFVENTNNSIALLFGIKPEDQIEGLLAVQMVGTHNLAMEFMRRAALKSQNPEGVTENVNRVTKLLRTFTAQVETLNKYRTKGQQKVTVEHVQVNAGGQAIVGILENKPGTGGTGGQS